MWSIYSYDPIIMCMKIIRKWTFQFCLTVDKLIFWISPDLSFCCAFTHFTCLTPWICRLESTETSWEISDWLCYGGSNLEFIRHTQSFSLLLIMIASSLLCVNFSCKVDKNIKVLVTPRNTCLWSVLLQNDRKHLMEEKLQTRMFGGD